MHFCQTIENNMCISNRNCALSSIFVNRVYISSITGNNDKIFIPNISYQYLLLYDCLSIRMGYFYHIKRVGAPKKR